MTSDPRNRQIWILASLALVVPLGLAVGLYDGRRGPIDNNLASVSYVVFWCLIAFLLFPKRKAITPIAVGVLLATFTLEILQQWQPPWLQEFRRTYLGGALIGTTFDASDFVYYVVGALMGWFWMYGLLKSDQEQEVPPRNTGRT